MLVSLSGDSISSRRVDTAARRPCGTQTLTAWGLVPREKRLQIESAGQEALRSPKPTQDTAVCVTVKVAHTQPRHSAWCLCV